MHTNLKNHPAKKEQLQIQEFQTGRGVALGLMKMSPMQGDLVVLTQKD